MTQSEFISYVKGILACELHHNQELTGTLKLIKDALDSMEQNTNTPFTPTPGFTIGGYPTGTEMVLYADICSCNPKNGGSGICGCIMGNQMVPKPNTTNGHNSYTACDIT